MRFTGKVINGIPLDMLGTLGPCAQDFYTNARKGLSSLYIAATADEQDLCPPTRPPINEELVALFQPCDNNCQLTCFAASAPHPLVSRGLCLTEMQDRLCTSAMAANPTEPVGCPGSNSGHISVDMEEDEDSVEEVHGDAESRLIERFLTYVRPNPIPILEQQQLPSHVLLQCEYERLGALFGTSPRPVQSWPRSLCNMRKHFRPPLHLLANPARHVASRERSLSYLTCRGASPTVSLTCSSEASTEADTLMLMPATSVVLELECSLLTFKMLSSAKDGDAMLQLLLPRESSALPSHPDPDEPSASQPCATPAIPIDRIATSRILAPMGSARQRSDRVKELLAAAMKPLTWQPHPQRAGLAAALCGNTAWCEGPVSDSRSMELEAQLPGWQPMRVFDPVRRLLHSRPPRPSSPPYPMTIGTDSLAAHEAFAFAQLLRKDDMCAQIHTIPHEQAAGCALSSPRSAAHALAEDSLIHSLTSPRRGGMRVLWRGENCRGGSGYNSVSNPIASAAQISGHALVTYRRFQPTDAVSQLPCKMGHMQSTFAARVLGEVEPMQLTQLSCTIDVQEYLSDALGTQAQIVDNVRGLRCSAAAALPCDSAHRTPSLPAKRKRQAQPESEASMTTSPATSKYAPRTAQRGLLPADEVCTLHDQQHVFSFNESFAASVDAFLHMSHGLSVRGARGSSGSPDDANVQDGVCCEGQTLQSKLLRHLRGQGSGLLAVLPQCIGEHVPFIAVEVISRLGTCGSGLWLLPEAMLEPALAFWNQLTDVPPGSSPLVARRLQHVPGVQETQPLRAGELGLAPLHTVLELPGVSPSSFHTPPADLVLLTATSPDIATCEAIAQRLVVDHASCSFIGLVCGLPDDEPRLSLAPICSALGVRKLLLRSEADPDVVALCSKRRFVPFVLPVLLKTTFETLAADAAEELTQLNMRNPAFRPLVFQADAIKQRIEQAGATQRSGRMTEAEQSHFWSLMTCEQANPRTALDRPRKWRLHV